MNDNNDNGNLTPIRIADEVVWTDGYDALLRFARLSAREPESRFFLSLLFFAVNSKAGSPPYWGGEPASLIRYGLVGRCLGRRRAADAIIAWYRCPGVSFFFKHSIHGQMRYHLILAEGQGQPPSRRRLSSPQQLPLSGRVGGLREKWAAIAVVLPYFSRAFR